NAACRPLPPPRRAARAPPRRAGRPPPHGVAPPPPAFAHRPALDPLPRPAVPRPRGNLPQPSQERYQPFPRLCYRLCRPPWAAVYRGPDRRAQGRAAQGRHPTPAPAGGPRRPPAPTAPVGSRLLQRGGDPLPPGGTVPVPDAGGLSRPLAQAAGRPQRQLRLPDLEDEWLVNLHPDRCQEADGNRVDLREVPQLPGAVEAARSADVDLCLLGLPA